MTIHSSQIELLSRALEFAQQNHRVISQNIANVNTPNYQTRELSFDAMLKVIERDSDSSKPLVLETRLTEGLPIRMDGNNVDLDREIASLKRNELIFQTLSQLMGARFDLMKAAIRG